MKTIFLHSVLALCCFSSVASAASIAGTSGAAVSVPQSVSVCTGETPLTHQSTLSMTSDEDTMWSLLIDPGIGNWYATKRTIATGRNRTDRGALNPLTQIVGPLAPINGVASEHAYIQNQGLRYSMIDGILFPSGGCVAARCFRVTTYSPSFSGETTINYTTALGGQVENSLVHASDPLLVFSFNRDMGAGNEIFYAVPTNAGVLTSTARAVAQGNSANALGFAVGTSIFVGNSAVPGQVERWTQAVPPVFLSSLPTSCSTILLSVRVVPQQGAVYTGCAGRINRLSLTTLAETATQAAGVTGTQTYNSLVYDPVFQKIYLGTYAAGSATIYRIHPTTLVVESSITQAVVNASGTGAARQHLGIDSFHGMLYLGGDLTTPGTYLMRVRYCT